MPRANNAHSRQRTKLNDISAVYAKNALFEIRPVCKNGKAQHLHSFGCAARFPPSTQGPTWALNENAFLVNWKALHMLEQIHKTQCAT